MIPPIQRAAHPSNFHRGRQLGAPRLVIIHTMQGTFGGTASWFGQEHKNGAPASAHYGVSLNGEVAQYVDEGDTAWHAGNSEYNALSVGVELEGDCDHPNFPEPMLAALVDLVRDICERRGIAVSRATIIGHCDVPDARKSHHGELGGAGHHHDPGLAFPWRDVLIRLAGGVVAA